MKKPIFCFILILLCGSDFVFADGMAETSSDSQKSNNSINLIEGKSMTLSENELLNFQYCGRDSDCMEVINGCCQCLQGDKFVAIAKNRLESFKAKFQCANISCPKEDQSISCEEGVVSCVNHRCTYFSQGF